VNLLLEKDGVLKGTTNPEDYPQVQTRWEGTEEMWTSAFVNAFNVTGLTISGAGTIDGSGENWGRTARPLPPLPLFHKTAVSHTATLVAHSTRPRAAACRPTPVPRPSPPGRHPERQGRAHHRCHPGAPGGVVPLHPLQPEC